MWTWHGAGLLKPGPLKRLLKRIFGVKWTSDPNNVQCYLILSTSSLGSHFEFTFSRHISFVALGHSSVDRVVNDKIPHVPLKFNYDFGFRVLFFFTKPKILLPQHTWNIFICSIIFWNKI